MEQKIPKTKKVIDDLHRDLQIREVELRSIKESVLRHSRREVEGFQKIDRYKAEINALLAIFIEDVWLNTLQKIEEHPPGLQEETGMGVKFLTDQSILSQIEVCKISDEVANFILQISKTSFRQSCADWEEEMQKRREKIIKKELREETKDMAYKRYLDLCISGAYPNFNSIESGINTALNTSWGIIKVIPKVFRQEFGRAPSPSELRKIYHNALPVIYALAGSHLQMFIQFRKAMAGIQYDETRFSYDTFIPKQFFFRKDERGELFLEIKSEILEESIKLKNKGDFYVAKTGCPAIYSIGPTHRNVIAEMYDWVIDLAEKYYLPALERDQASTG